jgi:hypothetical protein
MSMGKTKQTQPNETKPEKRNESFSDGVARGIGCRTRDAVSQESSFCHQARIPQNASAKKGFVLQIFPFFVRQFRLPRA